MAAVLLSACGGGDDGDSSGTSATTTATQPPAKTGEGGGQGRSESPSTGSKTARTAPNAPKEWDAAERAQYERERYGRPSGRSAGFQGSSKQGVLKHIPEFGEEAAASQRGAAQAALTAYLTAVAAGEWATACKYLLPYYVTTLEASSRAATGAPRDCSETLVRIYDEAAKQPGSQYSDGGNPQVTSFRVESYPDARAERFGVEQAGFALLHGSDGEDYWVGMTRENGQWKLTVPTPRPLVG